VLALNAGRSLAHLLDRGKQQADQDRDDRDHHQEFDQRKRRPASTDTSEHDGPLFGRKERGCPGREFDRYMPLRLPRRRRRCPAKSEFFQKNTPLDHPTFTAGLGLTPGTGVSPCRADKAGHATTPAPPSTGSRENPLPRGPSVLPPRISAGSP